MMEKAMLKQSRVSVSDLEEMREYITSEKDPKFFFTMTEVPKVGINPKTKFENISAVYAYPLTELYFNKLINGTLRYGNNMPYINVITTSQPLTDLKKYTDQNFNRDVSILKDMYGLSDDFVKEKTEEVKSGFFGNNYFGVLFWRLTKEFFNKNPSKWNSALRNLGYVGFYDPGLTLISGVLPDTAAIIDPSIIIQLNSFMNPHVKVDEKELTHSLPKEDSHLLSKNKKNIELPENLSNEKILNLIKNINVTNKKNFFKIVNNILKKDNLGKNIILEILNKFNEPYPSDTIEAIINHSNCDNEILFKILNKQKSIIELNDIENILKKPFLNKEILLRCLSDLDVIDLTSPLQILNLVSYYKESDLEVKLQIKKLLIILINNIWLFYPSEPDDYQFNDNIFELFNNAAADDEVKSYLKNKIIEFIQIDKLKIISFINLIEDIDYYLPEEDEDISNSIKQKIFSILDEIHGYDKEDFIIKIMECSSKENSKISKAIDKEILLKIIDLLSPKEKNSEMINLISSCPAADKEVIDKLIGKSEEKIANLFFIANSFLKMAVDM